MYIDIILLSKLFLISSCFSSRISGEWNRISGRISDTKKGRISGTYNPRIFLCLICRLLVTFIISGEGARKSIIIEREIIWHMCILKINETDLIWNKDVSLNNLWLNNTCIHISRIHQRIHLKASRRRGELEGQLKSELKVGRHTANHVAKPEPTLLYWKMGTISAHCQL